MIVMLEGNCTDSRPFRGISKYYTVELTRVSNKVQYTIVIQLQYIFIFVYIDGYKL